jgi:hypothetical protein
MEFIKTYFSAEKSESLVFLFLGIASIAFSTYALWKWNEAFYKGFAIPLITIGIIQLVVGSTVYFRTDNQVAALEMQYQTDVRAFKLAESPRMEKVMKSFSLYKKIEVAFVVIGLLLVIIVPSKEFWLGVGVGMLLQGALMLTADIFAERRGASYQDSINNIVS